MSLLLSSPKHDTSPSSGQASETNSLAKMDLYHVLEMIGEGSFGRVYKGRKKFSGQVSKL